MVSNSCGGVEQRTAYRGEKRSRSTRASGYWLSASRAAGRATGVSMQPNPAYAESAALASRSSTRGVAGARRPLEFLETSSLACKATARSGSVVAAYVQNLQRWLHTAADLMIAQRNIISEALNYVTVEREGSSEQDGTRVSSVMAARRHGDP